MSKMLMVEHRIEHMREMTKRTFDERLHRLIRVESEVSYVRKITEYLRTQKIDILTAIQKELIPIKDAKAHFNHQSDAIQNKVSSLERHFEDRILEMRVDLDNMKEPLECQINNIAKETECLTRELDVAH